MASNGIAPNSALRLVLFRSAALRCVTSSYWERVWPGITKWHSSLQRAQPSSLRLRDSAWLAGWLASRLAVRERLGTFDGQSDRFWDDGSAARRRSSGSWRAAAAFHAGANFLNPFTRPLGDHYQPLRSGGGIRKPSMRF